MNGKEDQFSLRQTTEVRTKTSDLLYFSLEKY